MSRLSLLLPLLACLFVVQPSGASQPDFHLQVVPAIVYQVDDPGNNGTSSFVFNIAVICSSDCELTPISARVELSSAGSTVERQDWTTEMLAKIKQISYRSQPNDPFAWPIGFTLPEAFDVLFYFRHPQALAIDSAAVRLTVADAKGHRAEQMLGIPIRYYQQKTTLIVPFHGHGIVGQDWITTGGHHQFSNGFGIDLDGLDAKDGELSDANENAADAGWGREILAPAGGTVVYTRNDVPENPHPGKPPGDDYYRPLHDPVTAYAGNSVIIDHGNSEYSVMMHMQTGSVTVKVGDRLVTGQVIGRLGSSGSSGGPHLHYQLQSGPRLWQYPSLPFRFQNIDAPLHRGEYFVAK